MLQGPKDQPRVAAALFGRECVLPLAAGGVYPKTRVWGSEPDNGHCSSAIEPLRIELRWGCEECSEKTAVGSGATFKYDPFGRRIYKSSSGGTSVYAYDGNELLEETNSSGSVVARYSQDLAIDAPLAMLRSSATSYYQADGLGSLTSLSSTAGTLAQTYTFDSFGNQTASSGSLTNPFRYTAREFDAETSLYFNRARYYDPASGRFINEDLIGFGGGGNFYRYVRNDPTGLADPMGLSPADVQRIKAACTKCTQGLTDSGFRRSGSGAWQGFLNDQLTYWNRLRKTHLQGCKSQAALAKPCLENPIPPYDNNWTFSEAPWWLGSHTVVRGESSDPNDPVVICDPWRNYTWTSPRAPDIPILPPM